MLDPLGIARGTGGIDQQGQCVIVQKHTFHRLISLNTPKEIRFNRAVCLTIATNKRNPSAQGIQLSVGHLTASVLID